LEVSMGMNAAHVEDLNCCVVYRYIEHVYNRSNAA
jgi:hypothetical protein